MSHGFHTHLQEIKMFKKLKSLFDEFSSPTTYQSRLESYLASKKPKSIVELEYWAKEFDRQASIGGFYAR